MTTDDVVEWLRALFFAQLAFGTCLVFCVVALLVVTAWRRR